MTSPHQIGQLLNAGVRPTAEETEHLREVGGFVSGVFERYFEGGPRETLESGSDSWAKRLSRRLSGATGDRWLHGIGLADSLLDNGIGSFWGFGSTGFLAGYEGFDPEMEVLALFEEEASEIPAVDEVTEGRVGRRSLFGARASGQAARKSASRRAKAGATGRVGGTSSLELLGLVGQASVGGMWGDGTVADLEVLRALAAGGLRVADQVAPAASQRAGAAGNAIGGIPAALVAGRAGERDALTPERGVLSRVAESNPNGPGITIRDLGQGGAAPTSRRLDLGQTGSMASWRPGGAVAPIAFDGLRIDDRTPALAVALARAEAVFGRSDFEPAVSSRRLEALTSGVKSVLGQANGKASRPVFGFYDSVEGVFLNLAGSLEAAEQASSVGDVGAVSGGGSPSRRIAPRGRGAGAGRSVESVRNSRESGGGTNLSGRSERSAAPSGNQLPGSVAVGGIRVAANLAAPIVTSLDRIVATNGVASVARAYTRANLVSSSLRDVAEPQALVGTRTFVGPRAFAEPRTAYEVGGGAENGGSVPTGSHSLSSDRLSARRDGSGPESFDAVSAVRYSRDGFPMAAISRSSVSAPRVEVIRFDRLSAEHRSIGENAEVQRLAGRTAGVGSEFRAETQSVETGGAIGSSGFTAANWSAVGQGAIALDGGSPMPLGATLSAAEVFAASRVLGAEFDVRAFQSDFRPVISKTPEDSLRVNGGSGALDGVVWISPTIDGQSDLIGSQIGAASSVLPFALVPRREGAVMVPASVALATVARGAPERLGAQRIGGDEGRRADAAVSARFVAAASGQRVSVGVLGALGVAGAGGGESGLGAISSGRFLAPAAFGERAPGSVVEMLRAGLVASEAVQSVRGSAGAASVEARRRSAAFANGGEGRAEPFMGEVPERWTGANVSRSSRTVQPEAALPLWVESLQRFATRNGIGAQFVREIAANPGYGHIDDIRLLVALSDSNLDAQRSVAERGGSAADRTALAGDEARVEVPEATGRRTKLVRASLENAQAGIRASRHRSVGTGAVTTASSDAMQRRWSALRSSRGMSEFREADLASPLGGVGVGAAAGVGGSLREARAALLRSVATARESRAVAAIRDGVVAAQVPLFGQGFVAASIKNALDGRDVEHGSSASLHPALSRLLETRGEEHGAAAFGARSWALDAGVFELIARAGGAEKAQMARVFGEAGWSRSELEFLGLERHDESSPALTEGMIGAGDAPTPARPKAGAQATERAAIAGSTHGSASAQRLARNVARMIGGAEALGGAVRGDGGHGGSVAARWGATGVMPLLERNASGYFQALAPAVTPRVARSGAGLVADAVGELVRMASEEGRRVESPDAASALRSIMRRASSAHDAIVSAESVGARVPAIRGSLTTLGDVAAVGAAAGAPGQVGRVVGAGAGAFDVPTATDTSATRVGALSGAAGDGRGGAGSGQVPVRTKTAEASVGASGLTQLERFELAQSSQGTSEFRERGGGTFARMDIPEVERTFVGLASDGILSETTAGVSGALAAGRPAREGVGFRVSDALAMSLSGPAGVARLAQARFGAVGASGSAAAGQSGRPVSSTARLEVTPLAAGRESSSAPGALVVPGSGEPTSGGWTGFSAASNEEVRADRGAAGLLSVLAPEVMLTGMRSPELGRALRAIESRQAIVGRGSVGVLATLADSGVDLGAGRTSLPRDGVMSTRRSAWAGGDRGPGGLFSQGSGDRDVRALLRTAAGLDSATRGVLVDALTADGDATAVLARAGLTTKQRAGLLSAILRGTERAERSSLLERAGGADFAFSWLSRVDGSRSGVDVGLTDAHAEFGRTFGRTRESLLAGSSPVSGANLVAPAGQGLAGEDRSGLRASAAAVTGNTTGATRPQHGASDAMRRTDWRFVETGSRASTSHADLGKLAAAIVGSSEAGKRAPMPLVAPAAKAVAQTALRKGGNESVAAHRGAGAGGGGGKSAHRPAPKLSEKAIEALAVEMANRVARLMSLMKERIGVW